MAILRVRSGTSKCRDQKGQAFAGIQCVRRCAYSNASGFSLIELLIALSLLAALATATSLLLIGTLQSQSISAQQDELVQTARFAMERMVTHTKQANRILIPLANNPTRSILALGGFIDNDGDGRYDEDPGSDMTADWAAGIIGIDDDGDGVVDLEPWLALNDDEDNFADEDPLNGLDDDGDGAIDEDFPGLVNEDGDAQTDEDPIEPIVYYFDAATKTLQERYPTSATTKVTTVLADQVDTFQVQRLIGANGAVLINILLRLKDSKGHEVELQTQVAPRNLGK